MKTTVPEMINILGWINASLDTTDEKISEREEIAIGAIQNETQEKRLTKNELIPVSCETLSSSLIVCNRSP